MPLKEIVPKSGRCNDPDVVRYAFYEVKYGNAGKCYYSLLLNIGINITQVLGLERGHRIKLVADAKNPRQWLLKKSDDGTGHLLARNGHGKTSLKCNLKWDAVTPLESEKRTTIAAYEIRDGALIIYANVQG